MTTPIGIDLGTTYSVAAAATSNGVRTLENAEGSTLTPSLVTWQAGKVLVGAAAEEVLAEAKLPVASCAKRTMGEPFYPKEFEGKRYPPEVIEGFILAKLRCDAAKQVANLGPAVVTVPAYFDETRRKATQDAATIAGWELLDIINEPTAAALAYALDPASPFNHLPSGNKGRPDKGRSDKGRTVLVYDLGGGTFDVTVMRVAAGRCEVLATDGDFMLGGVDWDNRLADLVATDFLANWGVDPREHPLAMAQLLRKCEEAKRLLSSFSTAPLTFTFAGHQSHVEFCRTQFEELTADLLERTSFTMQSALQAAGVGWNDIEHVLPVGGSAHMPMVQTMLTKIAGKPPVRVAAKDEMVAHGAAIVAKELAERGDRGRLVQDVNSHSLGIAGIEVATGRRRASFLIPRNTSLPVKVTHKFPTAVANQRSLKIPILEGESKVPEHCIQLGKCVVHPLPPDLPKGTKVSVTFRYEANGRLRIDVSLPNGEQLASSELFRDNMLSPEQLLHWRQHVQAFFPN